MQPYSPRLGKNNFDLLRLLFAVIVCVVHSYELSGFQQLKWLADGLSASVAVKGFFVISGFLIFMSYERSASLKAYAGKRIRRIYPAFATVVILCAVGLAAVSTKAAADYFSPAWLRYVLANLSFLNFLQPGLPGVFETHKLSAVNGALWTLKVEVAFYLCVPIFVALFRKFAVLPVIVLVYCASVAYASLLTLAAARTGSGIYLELARQFPGQLSYFMSGACLYYFLPVFERRHRYFLGAALVVLVASRWHALPLLEPIALAVVVIFFSLFLYAGNAGRYGDFSYGVYILHFPIIQLALHGAWFSDSPWQFFMAVMLCTLLGAMALWHWVEKRFLVRSSHYLAAVVPPRAVATGASTGRA